MDIVYVGDRNPSNRALLISDEEWKRLGKILTKKTDEEEAAKDAKRLKDMRREMSKKMVDSWDNTELNKSKKLLEQKRKAISELEARRSRRDEEMKREAQEARDRIVERARKLKFDERDETKTFNRAIQHSEVFRERAIQVRFNEAERARMAKERLATVREQNREAERHRADLADRARRNDRLKRTDAEALSDELKERDGRRRDERIASRESGEAESRRIAEKIERDRRKADARARAAKDQLRKDVADNRELMARNVEARRVEEWEEEMTTAIMAETKKILARLRRLREIELAEAKWKATEEVRVQVAGWPTKETGWAESDVRNAVEAREQRYGDRERARAEQAERRAEHADSGVRLRDETAAARRERSARERGREAARREREKALLAEFAELRRRKRKEDADEFREQLDGQCADKAAALAENRRADVERHEAFERRWRERDEQFMAYAANAIEEKKTAGAPIVPLIKTIRGYLEKNDLCLDPDGKVSKKTARRPTYTSRVIRLVD